MDDWDDMANVWNRNWDHMEVDPTPSNRLKRGRSRSRTPASRKRADRAPSRARGMQPRKLTFSSIRTRSRSRSTSVPRKKLTGKAAYFAARKNLPYAVKEAMWRQTAQGKRNQATLDKLKTRKVRHKLTRNMARYSKRRTTSRRKPYKARKGSYRGALLPRFMKGETKHILANDGCTQSNNCPAGRWGAENVVDSGVIATGSTNDKQSHILKLGEYAVHTLNPVEQGTGSKQRNGRSVDGTYLRIQGHIHNMLTKEGVVSGSGATAVYGALGPDNGRAYVRMLVLSIKGRSSQSAEENPKAYFTHNTLFKKIDGSVVGWNDENGSAGAGTARVRSLQLPINRQDYTVLADMKHELSAIDEGFGASDRMFDKKIKLKQRTTFTDATCDQFEKNHIILLTMVVDPLMRNSFIGTHTTGTGDLITNTKGVALEFESKYSYKDF